MECFVLKGLILEAIMYEREEGKHFRGKTYNIILDFKAVPTG